MTVEDLTPVRKRLTIEVPATSVQAELDRAFQQLAQRATLRGFRPGKAPRAVLERAFGAEVRRDVLGRLVEESFFAAVKQHKLAVVGEPEIDAPEITPGEPLRYAAVVDVRPEITLGDLGGLRVQPLSTIVSEEDVGHALEAMRESVAQLRPIEDRTVIEPGDIVWIDLTSRLDGGEPTHREGVLVEAGAGSFPLALERQLVGQHQGAQLSLRVPYPADHSNPALAGKTAELDVVVKELRAKDLPPLDDDFARDHGRCDSLAALRERIRVDLEEEARTRAADAVRQQVIEQLIARHTFDVPLTLVDRRTEALIASLEVRVPEGAERDQAFARLREQVRPAAERQVRAELLLDAVAAQQGIDVSDDDVHAEMDAIAAREQQVRERVRALYERPEAHAALRAKLVRDRVLERLASTVVAVVPSSASPMPPVAAESVAHEK